MTELRPKLAELFSYMDSTRASLVDFAQNMNPSLAMIRPRAGEWSAAENLAHLALVENNVTKLMVKTIADARAEGLGPDTSEQSFMSSLDRFRVADSPEKLVAPSRIMPDMSKSVSESLESLAETRQ